MKGNLSGKLKRSLAGVITGVMAVAMVIPAGVTTFAADATPDDVKCVVTVEGTTQTIEKDSLAEAIAAVNQNGTITVTGTINNDFTINEAGKAFTLDLSGVTFATDKKVTAGLDDACLAVSGGVYSYHPEHKWMSVDAVAHADDPAKADVVIYCEYQCDPKLETVEAGDPVASEDGKTLTYTATTSVDLEATWTVEKAAVPDTYALVADSVTYVQDATQFAVKDAAGKVQFSAEYTKNGEKAADKLTGEIKSSKVNTPATLDAEGTTDYVVTFTLPNGTKEDVEVEAVKDIEKLKPEQTAVVKGIQLQYNTADNKTAWGGTLTEAPAALDTETLVMGENGSLTYRLVYAATAGETDFYGDVQTLVPSKSDVKTCGTAVYEYAVISERYTDADGNIKTFTIQLPAANLTGKHEYATRADWASKFEVKEAASHDQTGTADVACQYCDYADGAYVVPKLDTHTFKQDKGVDVVETVRATCQDYGFQYKICTTSDGGWKDGEYVLDLGSKRTYTFTDATAFGEGHPVLVEGSVVDKVDHKFAVTSTAATANWTFDKKDNTCEITKKCATCPSGKDEWTYIYHSAKAPKNAVDAENEVNIYEAVTITPTAGADCSKVDTITYTVNGETDLYGDAFTKTVDDETYGPHTYKNTITFSADGKSATVVQQCTNEKCAKHADAAGNAATQTKKAEVTATENPDGSTTYTATLEGVELKDNTKTLFDLTKATVTVNEGKEIDLNLYEKADILKDLVVVTINGAKLDSKLYTADIADFTKEKKDFKVTVAAAEKADNVYGTAEGTAKCVTPAEFDKYTLKFDGETPATDEVSLTFDEKPHTVEVTPVDSTAKAIEGATVKYAVLTEDELDAIKSFDKTKLDYSLDKVELTDANDYYVYAKFSKEGYTDDLTGLIINVEIKPLQTDKLITLGQQLITYGSQLTASTGDTEFDAKIGLVVSDTTKLGVGNYTLRNYVSWNKNYNVGINTDYYYGATFTVEKRNATIVMKDLTKTYDGQAIDPTTLYSVDGTVNGDTLNVVVNTEGGKEAIGAGSYKLVATANDANYNIEKVTATLTITKAANTLKVAKASRTAKVKNLKKKAVTVAGVKVSNKGTGTLSYKIAKVNKNKANFKINAKNGKITVKKGTKKGTYKVTVSVTAKGNANVNKKTAKAVVTIKVK